MTTASSSRNVRSVASQSILPLAAVLLACTDPSPTPSSPGTPPVIASLHLWSESAVLNEGGGAVTVTMNFVAMDSDADVARVVVTLLDDAGAQVSQISDSVTNPPGENVGQITGLVAVSTTAITTYTVEVQAFDARGNGSNVLRDTFAVVEGNPLPTIASLTPDSAPQGGAWFTLTVTGTGFLPVSSVTWDGYSLPTTYVDGTTLQAQVDGYRLYYTGTAEVTVSNPAPGGGISNAVSLAIEPPEPNPVPTLTSISPTSAGAGGPSFMLTVTGTGFVAYSRIVWNGYYLSTTCVDANTLTATVSSSQIATPQAVTVYVSNPMPGGGMSESQTFTVTRSAQPGVTVVSLEANDIAWDPYQQKIYASVPSVSAVNPNTVTALDPFTGELTGSTWVGSEPDRIDVSDDGQFLYVALRGGSSVERLTLPDLSPDLSIGLGRDPTYGSFYANDLQVAPGSPRTVAVSLSTAGSYSHSGGLVVYDDGTPRRTTVSNTYNLYGSLQWGTTASELYAATSGYGYDLYALAVDQTGIVLGNTYRNAFSTYGVAIRFDPGTGLVYCEDGRAVDPTTGLLTGTYPVTSLYNRRVEPDSSLGSAFFVSSESWGSGHATLTVFDLTHYYKTRSSTITFVGGPPRSLIRWGTDGLAFLTPNLVVIVRGAAVIPPSTTEKPVPTIASLSPSSAAAGAPNLVLVVNGTGFVRGSTVQWNGSERATTFVSSTELDAYVPASDVAAAGSAEITVVSASPGGGTSTAASFTVNP